MTRLLSNVIKARYVSVLSDEKKVIDSVKLKEEQKPVEIKKETAVDTEDGFVEGLQALFIDRVDEPEEDENEAGEVKKIFPELSEKKAVEMIETAKQQAATMIAEAKKEADDVRKNMYNVQVTNGYQDGIKKAEEEYQKKLAELDRKEEELQQDYEQKLMSLEPRIASIICSFVEKITGIAAQYQECIVLHLLSQAITGAKKSEDYIIRVSADDLLYVNQNIDKLKELISSEASIRVIEDNLLSKNQCMIETDTTVIDCSLDTELKQLIMDIKMLNDI